MVDIDDDSPAGRMWEAVAGIVGGGLAMVFGLLDQVFLYIGDFLTLLGLDPIVNTLLANAPTLFTMLSVAQAQFESALVAVAPKAVWQTATITVGLLFLLTLGNRFYTDVRRRVEQ